MTSTSFNVGLTGATRNSSKVLKPPGGGSSDIFGSTVEHIEPQRKARSHLTSSIFTEETTTPARKPAAENGTKSEASVVNGTASSTNSAAPTPAPAAAPAAAPAPAPAPNANRPRVPPGGFSSGLW